MSSEYVQVDIELQTLGRNLCIYKVPYWLKGQGLPDPVYVPEVISFGPYHRDKPHIQDMEYHKKRVLNKILSRNKKVGIDCYRKEIEAIEQEVRACYEGPVTLNKKQFVEMLVLDGCFILEFLWGVKVGFNNIQYEQNDPVFFKETMVNLIARDMLKLENQVPMIVLRKLTELQKKFDLGRLPEFIMFALTQKWVTGKSLSEGHCKAISDGVAEQGGTMLHVLDVYRKGLLHNPNSDSPIASTSTGTEWEEMVHSVVDLKKAGVRFKKRKPFRHQDELFPFWDIKFHKRGVLEIPPIVISDHSKAVFLNLITYEQCHFNRPWDMVITDYVAFMDNLINSADDVCQLHRDGIIVHHLGSNAEVADLFNGLVKRVFLDRKNGRFSPLYQQLNEYCSHITHRWHATLRLEYLRDPCVVISLVVAFIILVSTVLQAIYTVYPYWKVHKYARS